MGKQRQESKKYQRFHTSLPEFRQTPVSLAVSLVLWVTFKHQVEMHKATFHLHYNFLLEERRKHYWILSLVTPRKRLAARDKSTTFSVIPQKPQFHSGWFPCLFLPLDNMTETQFRLQGPL